MSKIDTVILKILKIAAYTTIFLPLFVIDSFYYPYIVPRTVIFRIIVEIMALFFIFLILRNKEFLKEFNWIHLTIFFFISWLFVAGLTGVNFYKSFWGTMQRSEGIFSLLHYFIFLIIVFNIFRERKEWLRIFNLSSITSFLISVYAILQYLGVSALTYEAGTDRAKSTIGNAGFFATFLIFAIFINLILFINKLKNDKNNKKRVYLLSFYCFNILLNLIGLIIANTRGAILGLAIGILILFGYFIKTTANLRLRKKLIYILIVLLLIVFVLFLARNTKFISQTFKLSRIFNLYDVTAKQRLYAWKLAFQGFKDHPLLGVGPENYNYIFNKYFTTEYFKITSESWFDRAHNIIFEILTTSGIVGLIFYFSIALSIFWYLFKLRKIQTTDKNEIVFLAVLLGVYFIQNLFIFDVINSYLMLSLVLGFISFLISQNRHSESPIKQKDSNSKIGFSKKFLFLLIIIFIFLGININVRQLLASFYGADAYKTSLAQFKNTALIFSKYEKFLNMNAIGTIELKKEFATYISKIIETTDINKLDDKSKKQLIYYADLAGKSLEKEIEKENFSDAKDLIKMGRYLQLISSLYADKKIEILNKSTDYYKKALDLSSNKYYVYNLIAQNKIALEDYQSAIEYGEKSLSLEPNFGGTYWLISVAYSGLKNNTKTIEFLKKAIDKNIRFESINDVKYAIQLVKDSKDFDTLIYLYKEMTRINPEDAQSWASLAYIYFQAKNYSEARDAAMKVWALNPFAEAEIKAFLKKIEIAEKIN